MSHETPKKIGLETFHGEIHDKPTNELLKDLEEAYKGITGIMHDRKEGTDADLDLEKARELLELFTKGKRDIQRYLDTHPDNTGAEDSFTQ